jgi:hypothetical protein
MSSEEFWAVLEEGEDYYEEGDFEAALDRFDRAVAMSRRAPMPAHAAATPS